ncbi:CLUMA_CG009608, isoform A [Clunio marinus]|uniref:CLUMA_CG009608, isoform A n=1 Tax=Clunio marinus TaxID=568069 RepID=A0A1J1I7L5_9DIPT|nr:CLUMA_CG009608, isoform A [Clunio marinus]
MEVKKSTGKAMCLLGREAEMKWLHDCICNAINVRMMWETKRDKKNFRHVVLALFGYDVSFQLPFTIGLDHFSIIHKAFVGKRMRHKDKNEIFTFDKVKVKLN